MLNACNIDGEFDGNGYVVTFGTKNNPVIMENTGGLTSSDFTDATLWHQDFAWDFINVCSMSKGYSMPLMTQLTTIHEISISFTNLSIANALVYVKVIDEEGHERLYHYSLSTDATIEIVSKPSEQISMIVRTQYMWRITLLDGSGKLSASKYVLNNSTPGNYAHSILITVCSMPTNYVVI